MQRELLPMQTPSGGKPRQTPNATRRALISYLPLGVVGAFFGSLATAAFRFLRPVVAATNDQWLDVSRVGEFTGSDPVSKKVVIERVSGWSVSNEEHNLYLLPDKNQVLSAVCPHEGCEVAWEAATKTFSCPCHTSFFAADGSRIRGPARRGLDLLPTRIQDGKLQVQYQLFENNSTERIPRA